MNSARSRTSTYCTGMSNASGTSTSPPRANRTGQYVKRSVGSCGPTISPGRTMNVRSAPNAAIASCSHKYFSAPYVSGVITSRDAPSGSSGIGVDSSTRGCDTSYTEMLETKTYRAARSRSACALVGDDGRDVRRRVDDGVPRRAWRQPVEIGRAVAEHALDAGEQLAAALAAVEQRDLVPAREQRLDDVAAEKDRPAEHEDAHYIESGALTPHSASAVASTVFVAMHRPSRAVVVAVVGVSTRQAS